MSFIQDTYLSVLKFSTKLQLAKYRPQIIGITGSAGKSSAVLATYVVMNSKYKGRVQYTKKGNSETGIPFEVLNIPVESYQGIRWLIPIFLAKWRLLTYWPSYKFFVVEMGIDSDQAPKNMEYQLDFIHPVVGALLNVSSVHGANFSGADVVQAIANEKRKLLTALPQDGLAVFSADHPQILHNDPSIIALQKTFSVQGNKTASMFLNSYTVLLSGTEYHFSYQNKKYILQFKNQLHTEAAFGSFATALLIGEKFGVSVDDGIIALEKEFALPPGRMSIFEGISGTTLIDSSYNSSPESTASALEMFDQLKTSGRKIIVLGDMRELGPETISAHQKLADQAAKTADVLIWVGPLTWEFSYEYLKKKSLKKIQHSFSNAWEAVPLLKELLKKGDLVLVKGSQNTILLEIIVEALLKHPEKDTSQLCRRSEYWERQRQALKRT